MHVHPPQGGEKMGVANLHGKVVRAHPRTECAPPCVLRATTKRVTFLGGRKVDPRENQDLIVGDPKYGDCVLHLTLK